MKKILCALLALAMLLTATGCGSSAPAGAETVPVTQPTEPAGWTYPQGSAPAGEYERAFWYAIAPQSLGQNPERQITEKEMVDLLGTMIEIREGNLSEWQALTAGASAAPLYRDYGAMLMLYAAELMDATEFSLGIRYPHFNQPGYIHEDYDAFFSDHRGCYTLLEVGGEKDARAICQSITSQLPAEDDPQHYMSSCKIYLASRLSLVTGAMLMDFDYDTFTFHLTEPLSVEDALISLVRLFESFPDVAEKFPETGENTAQAAAWLQEARDKRDAIIHSETTIVKSDTFIKGETYTGTAYYLSNDGDDSADGTSPETAWATVERLNRARLRYGDAVFFRRGDLWRMAAIYSAPGITYSAYGEGPKPKIYGSEENGGSADKWTLYHEGENGEKIWLYANAMLDSGAIVMNHGQAVAEAVTAFWNGQQYQCYSSLWHTGHDEQAAEDQASQPVFDPKIHLTEDMTYFSQADSHLPSTLPIYLSGYHATYISDDHVIADLSRGPVYLRCDSGNPGELYEDIEFLSPFTAFALQKDAVVDNLDIAYSGTNHIDAAAGDTVIQNCCLGWVGGCAGSYALEYVTAYSGGCQRNGGAIGAGASGNIIRNNYVYETYQEGITVETAVDFHGIVADVTDILVEGNVLYHSVSPLLYCNWDVEENPLHQYRNIVFRDNFTMFGHMSPWTDDHLSGGAFVIDGGPNMQDGTVVVENNTFFATNGALVFIADYVPEYLPTFRGNRFAQFTDRMLIRSGDLPTCHTGSAQDGLNDILKDETAAFLPLNRSNWSDRDW